MFQNRLRFARIFGIPIYVDASWILIFLLITFALATAYFPRQYSEWSTPVTWFIATITSLLFFASVLAHELSHSVTSIALGRQVRGITLFLFGGVAEIEDEQVRARDEFLVAIMGPVASIVIGLGFLLIAAVVPAVSIASYVDGIARYLGTINVLLAVFNLIPGFPLDGGRVLRSIIWAVTGQFEKASRIAASVGEFVAWAFIVVGALIALQGALINGLWLAFIGWFLLNAARSSYRQIVLQRVLSDVPVRELMRRGVPSIAPRVSVHDMIERTLQESTRAYLVAQDGVVSGIVTLTDVRDVPESERRRVAVEEVMTVAAELHTTEEDATLWNAFNVMAEADIHQLPVLNAERQAIGLIQRSDLMRYLHLKTGVREV